MEKITLITFTDCPRAEEARRMLREIGLPFVEIVQDGLAAEDPRRFFTSPSILIGDELIAGSKASGQGGCSIALPSLEGLRRLLRPR